VTTNTDAVNEEGNVTDVTEQVTDGDEKPSQLRSFAENANKRAEDAEAKLRNVVLKAVGANPAQSKAISATYDGDWDDLDAVKAHAVNELGFTGLGGETVEAPAGAKTTEEAQELGDRIDRAQQVDNATSSKEVVPEPAGDTIHVPEPGDEGVFASIADKSKAFARSVNPNLRGG
jgi:hypothetical protein